MDTWLWGTLTVLVELFVAAVAALCPTVHHDLPGTRTKDQKTASVVKVKVKGRSGTRSLEP